MESNASVRVDQRCEPDHETQSQQNILSFPNIIEEDLYIKCLFKTISLQDLKKELKKKKIEYSLSDSYHILTLKIRAHILKESRSDPNLVKPLEDEISFFNSTVRENHVYSCCFNGCPFKTKNHKHYMRHLRDFHSNSKQKMVCKLKGCQRDFSGLVLLEIHLKTAHKTRPSLVKLRQSQLVEQFLQLRCLSASCNHQNVQNIKELKKHLNFHFEKAETVPCIFSGCDFKTDVAGTLRVHFSRKHRIQDVESLKPEVVVGDLDNFENFSLTEDDIDTGDGNEVLDDSFGEDEEVDNEDEIVEDENDQLEIFMRAIAITFSDWMNLKNIPYSTCNLIIHEVFNSYSEGKASTQKKIRKLLLDEELEEDRIGEILRKIAEDDPFDKARAELESEGKRIKFIKETFEHTQPETIYLPTNKDEAKESYQYVPITESLKVLLEDETYIKQKLSDGYFSEDAIYKDVRDGEYFKANKFFERNPEAVPIMMFQDELEVANPLGSGKCKHKINCTYYTTYDVQSPLRSKTSSIQLVSLIRSKYWKKHGNEKTNKRLLDDLKKLEDVGIEIKKPSKKTVKAGLVVFVGDNLGLHQLAEYNACFSSGGICRICKAQYGEVCREHLLYAGVEEDFEPELFTESVYDELANTADRNGGPSAESCGIKTHCVFNCLESFHCATGMPPCLGHDFFEGLFSYDFQFLVDFIINKEKLLTTEEFNRRLSKCKLSLRDSRNRPNLFKTRAINSKYEGTSGQLRVLSRIMTMILYDVIDRSETAGKMIIKLQEVAEIVTAPKLSTYEIDFEMTEIIESYLDLRISAISSLGMPHARPKHHFLGHYPRCYKKYGPLISLWAMRMESKHTYFKGVIKASKNFKNVSKTCASRHELAQVCYRYYGLFPVNKFDIPSNSVSLTEHRDSSTDIHIRQASQVLRSDSLILTNVKIHGTVYSPGMIVVMKKESLGVLKVGLIRIIAFQDDLVYFVCSTFIAMQSRYNFYVTRGEQAPSEIISYDDLQDYYPLLRIGTTTDFRFALHHYISSGAGV